jgi:hypothetical protein
MPPWLSKSSSWLLVAQMRRASCQPAADSNPPASTEVQEQLLGVGIEALHIGNVQGDRRARQMLNLLHAAGAEADRGSDMNRA